MRESKKESGEQAFVFFLIAKQKGCGHNSTACIIAYLYRAIKDYSMKRSFHTSPEDS